MQEQFVEDYQELRKFMDNINESLTNLDIDSKYESYDEFCKDIENNLFELLDKQKQDYISPAIMIEALNTMIKKKISNDVNYEDKIKKYLDDPEKIIDDLKKMLDK